MLFHVKAKFYEDLNITLLELPAEQVLDINPLLSRDLQITVDPKQVSTTTEHVTENNHRFARAAVLAYLTTTPPTRAVRIPPEPESRALRAFPEVIVAHMKARDPIVSNAVKQAFLAETLAHCEGPGPGVGTRLALPLAVEQPYSVKGIRQEAQRQRAEDAAAIASHQLIKRANELAVETVLLIQAHLIDCIEAYNEQQVRPLLTKIDLGLLPQKAYAAEVTKHHQQCQQIQAELRVLQDQAEHAWKDYSTMYKSSVAKDLLEAHPDDRLLEQVLTNRINRYDPLRYL